MDLKVLHDCFAGTLQPDESIRDQAERSLKNFLTTQPNFLSSCISLIALSDNQINEFIKHSTSIYLKNQIKKNWEYTDSNPPSKSSKSSIIIPSEEKQLIKSNLLNLLLSDQFSIDYNSSSNNHIKAQILVCLLHIISLEYPNDWPNLLNDAVSLLNNSLDEQNKLFIGLYCFKEIMRHYRWKGNSTRSESLDPIIHNVFPILIDLANTILNSTNSIPNDVNNINLINKFNQNGELIRLIIKTFKFVTFTDLPEPFQNIENVNSSLIFPWINLQLTVISKKLPLFIVNLSNEAKISNPWVKSQKWSFANLFNLLIRFCSSSKFKSHDYPTFKKNFVALILPEIIKIYFKLISDWCQDPVSSFMSNSCLYYLINLVDTSIVYPNTWKLISANLQDLIANFIYPLVIPTDEVINIFETDPNEYIHMRLDIFEETSDSPDFAAASFLVTLASKRPKSSLNLILEFIYNNLIDLQHQQQSNNGIETLDIAKNREGLLRILSSISFILTNENSEYLSQMESFFNQLVLHNLNSEFGFLKARTLKVLSSFSSIEFTDSSIIELIYQGIIKDFNLDKLRQNSLSQNNPNNNGLNQNDDSDEGTLVIQLESSLAMQAFIQNESFKILLEKDVILIVQRLLILSDKIDTDSISAVMQELVEQFFEQLQPFGAQLVNRLSEQFIGIIVGNNNVDLNYLQDSKNLHDFEISPEYLNESSSDKQMVALGLLNTMVTILLSFENSQDSIENLLKYYSPVIKIILINGIDDYFAECFDLIENTSFLSRKIFSELWEIFDIIIMIFQIDKDSNTSLLYLDEIMPSLNNYFVYGFKELVDNKNFETINKFYLLYFIILNNGYEENIVGNLANYNKQINDIQDTRHLNINGISIACEFASKFMISLGNDCRQFIKDILVSFFLTLQRKLKNEYINDQDTFDEVQIINSISSYIKLDSKVNKLFKSYLANRKFSINFLNLILAGFMFDTVLTLEILTEFQFIEFFFQKLWFKSISKGTVRRVYDLKITLIGLLSLVNLDNHDILKFNLNLIMKDIRDNIVLVLGKLPKAINDLETKKKSYAADLSQSDFYSNEFGADEFVDVESVNESSKGGFNENDGAQNDENNDDNKDNLLFEIDEDDDLFEDPLSCNPLDNINIFEVFKTSLIGLRNKDENKYKEIFENGLTHDQITLLKDVLNV
ncbi:Nmd5p [Ascoidea rubescens DSM 1968]|uniref:ARM repeat-containing protein n=1 Tax=Ascoidea rubescens DSM 1968 TaxID=1344418 RepID=A0A1D2VF50_9ASCO|nr:ARM repeat-containing protein [Ascoidea rubescens DSM 1968]ODV60097.1 ARM repeat-containing protein [Ascoidea rubescens DSM 1968]